MIELYQLRYFLAVVETGSFTKAAERVYVTQPTLSAGIQKLEIALKCKLFDRSSKRVFLTENGSRFVERAKSVLHQLSLAEAELQSVDAPRLIRLGVLMTIPSHIIRQLLQTFQREEAGLVIELFEGTEQEIQNRLEGGRVDSALTIIRTHRTEKIIPLYQEKYHIVLASHHPLSQKKNVHPADLAEVPIIVRSRCELLSETSRFFTDHNVRPRMVYRTAHDERAAEMVAAGIGFATLPDHYNIPDITRLNVQGYDFERKIGLLSSDHPVSSDRQALLEKFHEFARTSLPTMAYEGTAL